MTAIFTREFRSYFTGMVGYAVAAAARADANVLVRLEQGLG